jgi:serine/threonine protein kinase/tetratricopeptide (TPR) repeat protein
MNEVRWDEVKSIFHAALELPPGERPAFLRSKANGNDALRMQVEALLSADEKVDGFLEDPPLLSGDPPEAEASPPLLSAGETLRDRFHIVELIGEGGMGQVFRAYDSDLQVHVALKVIRPEIGSHAEALPRFRREAQLARRVTHPNVCRTFDLDRELRPTKPGETAPRELVFQTMELLEGETLKSHLERTGALPLEEALAIARQIAAALTAAHSLGIIHRDIKPANIMLVPDDSAPWHGLRVVVTDFGLARGGLLPARAATLSMSNTKQPVGTLAYMAPEQLDSDAISPTTAISPATDIYAFGLVLYETVTGARAFPEDNFLAGISQRLAGKPPSPRGIRPDLPDNWEAAIEGCLRREPAERFQKAADVVACLEGGAPAPLLTRTTPWTSRALAWLSPRRRGALVAAALGVVGLVSLFAAGMRLYLQRADSTLAPGALVYLADVGNQTGEKSLDNVKELMQASLTQSAHINLLDPGRVGDILQQMTKAPESKLDQPTAREVAMRAGAARVVFANITSTGKGQGSKNGGSYKLSVDIQQPDNTPSRYRDHWAKSWEWTQDNAAGAGAETIPPELLRTLREASSWIRREVGESANDIARLDAPPEDVTTGNWEALQDFAYADQLAKGDRREEAASALKSAIHLDPGFAMAYGRLGDLLFSVHRDEEGLDAYERALDSANRTRLTRKELDRIKGVYAVDTGDYQAAIDAFHDYTLYYENDYLGWVYPTAPLRMLGRDDEAISNLRKAVKLNPKGTFAPYSLAEELILTGQTGEARSWIDRLRRAGQEERALDLEGIIQLVAGDFDAAKRTYQSLSRSATPYRSSFSYSMLARISAEQRRYEEALDVLETGLQEDRKQGNIEQQAAKLLDRAYVQVQTEHIDRTLQDVHEALGLSLTPRTVLFSATVLGTAAIKASSAQTEKIRRELIDINDRLPAKDRGPVSEIVRRRIKGELFLVSGKAKEGLSILQSVDRLDSPFVSREYLGRAFEAVARQETDVARAADLRRQALAVATPSRLRPAFVWAEAEDFPPGFLASQLSFSLYVGSELNGATRRRGL